MPSVVHITEPVAFRGLQGLFVVPDEILNSPVETTAQGRLL